MEGIKPTRANDIADRRDGGCTGHGATPTYHGELGCGGQGGRGRCGCGTSGRETESRIQLISSREARVTCQTV